MSGDDTIEAALRKALEADQKLAAEKAEPSAEAAALRARARAQRGPDHAGRADARRVARSRGHESNETGFSDLPAMRLERCSPHAETAQTEIDPVTYQRKCKIAPNAADFYCPELERAVERSRRWDPIVRNN
jgi:hypothetical protein